MTPGWIPRKTFSSRSCRHPNIPKPPDFSPRILIDPFELKIYSNEFYKWRNFQFCNFFLVSDRFLSSFQTKKFSFQILLTKIIEFCNFMKEFWKWNVTKSWFLYGLRNLQNEFGIVFERAFLCFFWNIYYI